MRNIQDGWAQTSNPSKCNSNDVSLSPCYSITKWPKFSVSALQWNHHQTQNWKRCQQIKENRGEVSQKQRLVFRDFFPASRTSVEAPTRRSAIARFTRRQQAAFLSEALWRQKTNNVNAFPRQMRAPSIMTTETNIQNKVSDISMRNLI